VVLLTWKTWLGFWNVKLDVYNKLFARLFLVPLVLTVY